MRRSGKQGKTLSVLWTAGKSSAGRKELKIQTLTMDLSSLNVDVLLYLIKFVDPVDRFNLVSSGILKGFENVNKGIDLDKRYSVHLTFDVNGNQIYICPELKELELNWGYVVIARAS